MNGEARRAKLLALLRQSHEPRSGSELARELGVSRQVIVQDMALLRARTGLEILSTYRGYLLGRDAAPCRRVFKVRHSAADTRRELQAIVDLGGRVEDVFVFHKVYGVVRGALRIASRREIDAFLERLQESSSEPLMRITDDFHYHTVAADSEEILDAVEARLGELGLLAPLREYEPEDVKGR